MSLRAGPSIAFRTKATGPVGARLARTKITVLELFFLYLLFQDPVVLDFLAPAIAHAFHEAFRQLFQRNYQVADCRLLAESIESLPQSGRPESYQPPGFCGICH